MQMVFRHIAVFRVREDDRSILDDFDGILQQGLEILDAVSLLWSNSALISFSLLHSSQALLLCSLSCENKHFRPHQIKQSFRDVQDRHRHFMVLFEYHSSKFFLCLRASRSCWQQWFEWLIVSKT